LARDLSLPESSLLRLSNVLAIPITYSYIVLFRSKGHKRTRGSFLVLFIAFKSQRASDSIVLIVSSAPAQRTELLKTFAVYCYKGVRI